ncbi:MULTISPECIES: hypothetical protein [unclassified Clostridium]|uniref:hypothetical protein n=1 Tax=unclassified Clostridium TaxID=2614128 RepID=UPI00207963AB|nr:MULTISPECIES: hypothetical protein [unclassified Clostridium]
MEKQCFYCKKGLNDELLENKVGYFCNEVHYDKYLKNLSWDEYIELQHSFCACNDN